METLNTAVAVKPRRSSPRPVATIVTVAGKRAIAARNASATAASSRLSGSANVLKVKGDVIAAL
jgi:hypothetical protein